VVAPPGARSGRAGAAEAQLERHLVEPVRPGDVAESEVTEQRTERRLDRGAQPVDEELGAVVRGRVLDAEPRLSALLSDYTTDAAGRIALLDKVADVQCRRHAAFLAKVGPYIDVKKWSARTNRSA